MSSFACVLDSSALLAVLQRERGAEMVEPLLADSAISAVNWSETLQKSLGHGLLLFELRQMVSALGVTVVPFTTTTAEDAASLWPQTRSAGLSLGDRACLALARREAVPALTTDRAWASIAVDVDIRVIR